MESSSAISFIFMMMFYWSYYRHDKQQLTVEIPSLGRVLGSRMLSVSGRNFEAFRGIPYAESPVGDLRFADPVAVKSWGQDILDASKEGPFCMQLDVLTGSFKGQEDCLVLNVYTPSCNYGEDALPVMVWIHGGGFIDGSGNGETDLYGPGYFLDRDVVLVTINYRLGALGFLSTEDAEAPGNYGLLDQSLALKWVHEHISHFGGNPESITIFGESAGGASVEFHMLSSRSKGLFHRAIAQSGSSRCLWAMHTNVGKYTQELAEQLNCSTSSSKVLLDCLRIKDGRDIMESRRQIQLPFAFGLFPIAFGPRIDSERDSPFLPDDPASLISRKLFNSVPYIGGVTQDEGAVFGATLATTDGQNLKVFNKDPIKSILYSLGMENRKDGLQIAKKVYDHYFTSNNKETYEQYGQFMSDFGFFKCVDESVDLLSRYSDNPIYYYYYAHRGQLSVANFLDVPAAPDLGVVHGDELLLMFSSNLTPPLSNPNDIKVKNTLLDLWTSFASFGIPKSEQLLEDWKPIKDGERRYLQINAQRLILVNSSMPFQSNLTFWNRLFTGTD